MSKGQVKVTIEAPQGHDKTRIGNAVEDFIHNNFPGKSVARFKELNYPSNLIHSNCDVVIVEKQTK